MNEVTAFIDALTQDDYKKMAAELNTMATQAKDVGLKFAYHNHNMEFRKWSDGTTTYEILMAETDPALVKIELDCGWADLGGHPPLELFKKYPGRFRMLHIKDFAPTEDNIAKLPFGEAGMKAWEAGSRPKFDPPPEIYQEPWLDDGGSGGSDSGGTGGTYEPPKNPRKLYDGGWVDDGGSKGTIA